MSDQPPAPMDHHTSQSAVDARAGLERILTHDLVTFMASQGRNF